MIYLDTERKQSVCVMFIPDDRDQENCPFGTDFSNISQNYGGVTPQHPLYCAPLSLR